MDWRKIEVKPSHWRKGFVLWTALSGKQHTDMCPNEHPAMYVVSQSSNGWAASYGYSHYAKGGHKTEFNRTNIIAVCENPDLAMQACEQHNFAAP